MINIWIDTGGTFTDCIIEHNEELSFIKVLSDGSIRGRLIEKIDAYTFLIDQNWPFTKNLISGYSLHSEKSQEKNVIIKFNPINSHINLKYPIDIDLPAYVRITAGEEAPILAIRLGLNKKLDDSLENIHVKLGTTKGTNALLEAKGAKVLHICTKGFKDLSLIGTQQRPDIFQLEIPEPQKLFREVLEIPEAIDASGKIAQPVPQLDQHQIQNFEFDAVALVFKNAYANNANEIKLYNSLKKITTKPISVSSLLTSDNKLLNRTQSTLINAYLDPVLREYLERIKTNLTNAELAIMTSMGTLVDAHLFRPMDSLLSGPAGGLKGAKQIGEDLGYTKIITFDMGGTSTDVSLYHHSFSFKYRSNIGGFETSIPSLNIETVAAGGGSICFFEDDQLKVGPQSAGANPGPASYGLGGPLTITDVNLLLGKINPHSFQFPVNYEAAQTALADICLLSGLKEEEALLGFEKIANQKMAAAIQKISIRQGYHPQNYSMVSFGGAGGLHACKISESLGMNTIIFPYASGLLSAFGIGISGLEKIISKYVNIEVAKTNIMLEQEYQNLTEEAFSMFENTTIPKDKLIIDKKWISIGVKGQEASMDIAYLSGINIEEEYIRKYHSLFGFLPEDIVIEIRQIHLLILEKSKNVSTDRISPDTRQPKAEKYISKYGFDPSIPVYNWDALEYGDTIEGPAILYNAFGSVFIEEAWNVNITLTKQAVAKKLFNVEAIHLNNEVINLAVFSNRFQHIAEEMGEQLQKTAFSVNIKERLDFSCGILDAHGKLIANAPHIPVHLGSLGICTRLVLSKIAIKEGDIIITNHPKYGGSHLPDITLIMGVFTNTGDLIGYVINRAHHAEIGGSRPGSMPPNAKSLEEEGVVFNPQYLSKGGKFYWDDIRQQLSSSKYPSRSVNVNIADLKAAVASLKAGEKALLDLFHEVGVKTISYYMNLILENTSSIIAKALAQKEQQHYFAEEYLDDGRSIKLNIYNNKNIWTFDFTGTSSVHPGNLNANASIVHSAILYVLRLIADRNIPLNEGLMENIKIILPESFLNPLFSDDPALCPAVVGGNTEVSQRLVDTLLKAFSLSACSQGTMNNLLFGNEHFGYYETIGGGAGATKNHKGRSAVHQHMTNTRITDPEDLEKNYPVRLLEFSIRKNSGGKGKNNGGDGIIRDIEFLEDVSFTLISQHRNVAPYGLEGGSSGLVGKQTLVKIDGTEHPINGVDQIEIKAGERIRIESPGGGAFGNS